MKIAIISDIHNNEVNLKKVLNFCQEKNIQTIISCGDLASKETLDFLCNNFPGHILHTFGNAEYDDLRELAKEKTYKNAFLFENFGEATLEKKPIAFVHYPDRAKELARTGKYTHIFYGHTHKPWEVMLGSCKLLNPGTTAGEIYPPTFAIWDIKKDRFDLIRIHNLK
jgi:putative phosphoesterase